MVRLLDHTLTGARGKRVCMLIHPMGADKSFWTDFQMQMGDAWCMVASDQYGAGAVADITEPLSLDGHVRDLEALRHHLQIEQMVVIGCAIGAMIGARYTHLYPQHVSALVMTNPGLRTREAAQTALAARAQAVRAGGMDAVVPAATDAAFFGRPDDARKAAYVEKFRAQNAHNYAATIESILQLDLTDSYRQIRCPVLLVPGGQDKLFTPDHADEIKALMPHARLEVLAQGAHFIPYQCPDDLAVLVQDFLQRHAV